MIASSRDADARKLQSVVTVNIALLGLILLFIVLGGAGGSWYGYQRMEEFTFSLTGVTVTANSGTGAPGYAYSYQKGIDDNAPIDANVADCYRRLRNGGRAATAFLVFAGLGAAALIAFTVLIFPLNRYQHLHKWGLGVAGWNLFWQLLLFSVWTNAGYEGISGIVGTPGFNWCWWLTLFNFIFSIPSCVLYWEAHRLSKVLNGLQPSLSAAPSAPAGGGGDSDDLPAVVSGGGAYQSIGDSATV